MERKKAIRAERKIAKQRGSKRKRRTPVEQQPAPKPIVWPAPVVQQPVLKPDVRPVPVTPQPVVQPAPHPIAQPVAEPVPVARPAAPPAAPIANYLNLLSYQTQSNARQGGLDHLLSKNIQGCGQTVGVLEFTGSYKNLRDNIDNKWSPFPDRIKANYKYNFLPTVGHPHTNPESKNIWDDANDHGSVVSSVILELAPQAKVQPVSYNSDPAVDYDIGAALSHPALANVGVINISSISYKDTRFPEYVEIIKRFTRAGKVLVFAAGNAGKNIRGTAREEAAALAKNSSQAKYCRLLEFFMDKLDKETRKSIVIAGGIPNTAAEGGFYSNMPGQWKELQKRFIFAPGNQDYNKTPYTCSTFVGTSFAAPYTVASIADLTSSSPKVTPKIAVKALMKTADKVPNMEHRYGRGKIRVDKALEWLHEKGYR